MPQPPQLPVILLVSAVGGAMNAVAGGGTLLVFPALLGLGVPPVAANATCTVALWPGALSSMWGYRRELSGAGGWAARLVLPSVLGGLVGAGLLLLGGDAVFARLVPFLVLGATLLFMAQRPLVRLLVGRRPPAAPPDGALPVPTAAALVVQFLVAVYGGYFGAGAGILMLAALGLQGFANIHQMNGLKNWSALCFNAVAIATFALNGAVQWRLAAVMAVGTTVGGYAAAGVARRAPQDAVRGAVALIGFASAAWLLLRGG
ncbi:sulfite exporter TauE/SafE family protein [Roseisolibacter sp. H3M3-2]|uniref:sulfite exporter TauE/SafE family protein n=1 Tax=Roseisolibacter sp. H3M3-2 TaxID=3031323 RepID=UPI0023DA63F8|nr:sulfite exporter TauE/SafE family protein [Roseisolibacter sp. H3M3-2]MDF1502473.1 sulfite exporter TauE/SafE family protein [Roseisolibacter sp. H3M3-2]